MTPSRSVLTRQHLFCAFLLTALVATSASALAAESLTNVPASSPHEESVNAGKVFTAQAADAGSGTSDADGHEESDAQRDDADGTTNASDAEVSEGDAGDSTSDAMEDGEPGDATGSAGDEAGDTLMPSAETDEDTESGTGGTFVPSAEPEPDADDDKSGAGGTFVPESDDASEQSEDAGAGETFQPPDDANADAPDSGAGGTFVPGGDTQEESEPDSDPGEEAAEQPSEEEEPPAEQDYDESYYDSMWDDYDEAYGADEVEEEPADEVAEEMGRIEGTVIDGEFNEPATGVTVSIDETEDAVQTGESGYFYFDLPPGVYTVRFRGLGFENQVYSIEVQEGEVSEFEDGVVMSADRDTTMTMEVEAEIDRGSEVGQMVQRREAATTRDAISSDTISRTGDSSAKDAARRVVGVTLVDDKFLYVRGLGGRYTKVTLNDVPVPIILSTIPAVELDLLPTSLLSGLELFKVPEARLPGDFVGGLLNLQTSDYSRSFEISAGVSTSFNSQTTFRDVTVNENRGSFDWLGYDDGTRELPGSFDGVFLTPAGFGQEGLSREEINALARDLPNNFGTTEQTAPPEFGGSIEMSDTIDFDSDSSFAYRLAFDYGQGFSRTEYDVREIPDNAGGDGSLAPQGAQSGSTSEYSSQIGALGSARYDIDDDNELQLVLFYTNVLEDTIASLAGNNTFSNLRQTSYEFSRRNVLMAQLLGRHRDVLGGVEIDYSFTASRGRNYQPDRREITFLDLSPDDGEDVFTFSRDAGSGFRLYRDLTQNEYDGRLNIEIPIGDQFLRRAVRVGGVGRYMTRKYEVRRFRYLTATNASSDLTRPIDEVLADEEIGTSINFREQTLVTDPYDAWQSFAAGYGQLDWEFSEAFRATAGVRFENLTQEIDANIEEADGRRIDFDVLPSTSMVYGFADDMSLRLAYAASVARPSVRESSASTEFDYVRGFEIIGNPDLKRTFVHNADLRYEFFPSPSEVVAATFYYKQFINHIEPVVQNVGGSIAFENTASARSFGGEIEVQLDWGQHVDSLDGFLTALNVAAIYSQVELDDACGANASQTSGLIFTNCKRPMVGQAPIAFNALIGYGRDDIYGVNLVYNAVGPILLFPGANGQRDIYSSFYHDLDLTAFYQFHDNWKLKFKADNLMHWANKEYFGRNTGGDGFLLEREQEGTTFSVGIEFSLAGQDSGDSDVRTEASVGGEDLDLDETTGDADSETETTETDPVEEAIEQGSDGADATPQPPTEEPQEDAEAEATDREPPVETDKTTETTPETEPENSGDDTNAQPESDTSPPASGENNGAGGVFIPGGSEPDDTEPAEEEVQGTDESSDGASGVFVPGATPTQGGSTPEDEPSSGESANDAE